MTISYRLAFEPRAKKAWDKLDPGIKRRFQKKLADRLVNPRIQSAALRKFRDCYKIKLSSVGYRLVYRVDDDRLIVLVVAVGPRADEEVYDHTAAALRRLDD